MNDIGSASGRSGSERSYGERLRRSVAERPISCFMGVYDVFSASLAARRFDGLFVSGYGFAASFYGMPDIGFIAWSDMLAFVQRLRAVLPGPHLIVDIDDGYADTDVACHVVRQLDACGASGVIIEDQQRPRRCGHVSGKQIMPLEGFLEKLEQVLLARRNLFVVARTDASDEREIRRRARAFEAAGADAVLVDGLKNLETIQSLKRHISLPLMFNQIAGGKSPPCTLSQLQAAGVSLVNYSTPCLFAAQRAVEDALEILERNDGGLAALGEQSARLADCQKVLNENHVWSSLHGNDGAPPPFAAEPQAQDCGDRTVSAGYDSLSPTAWRQSTG